MRSRRRPASLNSGDAAQKAVKELRLGVYLKLAADVALVVRHRSFLDPQGVRDGLRRSTRPALQPRRRGQGETIR